MKVFAVFGNSFWLLSMFPLAVLQGAIAAPLQLSAKSKPHSNIEATQVNPNLLGGRRNRTPQKRVKAKPHSTPAQMVPPPPAPPQNSASDWAITTLQTLSERYNCQLPSINGSQGISRNEFAASLSDCILKMEESIATKAVEPLKEDLAALENLQEEFASELATLIIRMDEKADKSKQFSTTTKLAGEAVFAAADTFGDRPGGNNDPTVPVFGYRARLNFNASFTGQDQLRVRLQARDVPQFSGATSTNTNMTRLGFDGQGGSGVTIDDFFYKFPIGSNTTAWLIANGYGSENLAPHLSPISSSGRGALSRLARYSPIYRMVEGPGVGVQHDFSDDVKLSLAYRVRNGTNATPGNGLFNGNYGILTQLTVKPVKDMDIGLQYVDAYFPAGGANVAGGTGSAFAQTPFAANTATKTSTYAMVASYSFSPQFSLSGWAGFTEARGQSGTDVGRSASVSNWMLTLAFPDLGQKGNFGALSIGMPPKVTSNDNGTRLDPDTSLHLEVSYRHQLNENVAVTPGFFVITNPNHNSNNPTQVVGVVRTTISF
jgi:hypothetical protein